MSDLSRTSHPVLELLAARVGLAFRTDQIPRTLDTIERAMRRKDVSSPYEFAHLLREDVPTMEELIVELTVGETYFFRELNHFRFVRERILPEILERNGEDHVVRIWSAACASGEEVYSLAMLCHSEGLAGRVRILGTDISTEALAKARNAVYRPWSLRGEGAEIACEYLRHQTTDPETFVVEEQIRKMVNLEFLNLAVDPYPSAVSGTARLDLIFCRNVMIYFTKDTIRDVARRFMKCLTPGGWLITASGDPSLERHADFETVVTKNGVFYRRPLLSQPPTSGPPPAASRADDASAWPSHGPNETATTTAAPSVGSSAAGKHLERTLETLEQLLLDARAAFDHGDYQRAVQLTEPQLREPAASVLHVKSLANIDAELAERKCGEVVKQHALSAELHHLHAVLLMEVNRNEEAFVAAQRAIYLDGGLAMAHFTSGSILHRQGRLRAARMCFRNALELCEKIPAGEAAPLADEQTAGELGELAEAHLAMIQKAIQGGHDRF